MHKRVYTTKKNVLNSSECIIFKAKNPTEGASIKEESESEEKAAENEERESNEQDEDAENEQIVEKTI